MPAAAAKGKAAASKKSGAHHAKRGQNSLLKKGITKRSRSTGYHHKGGKPVPKVAPKPADHKPAKTPRWYPADNTKRDRPRSAFRTWDSEKKQWIHKRQAHPLRASITKGTVLILLAGKFRGSRVIFLKQLASGLLLVTGPFKINGVPIRRVNQAYVIATSTKVELPKLDLKKFNDDYFKKEKKATKAPKEDKKEVFADGAKHKPKHELAHHKQVDQKAIDKPIMQVLKKTPFLKAYLRTGFALQKGQYPHRMNF